MAHAVADAPAAVDAVLGAGGELVQHVDPPPMSSLRGLPRGDRRRAAQQRLTTGADRAGD
ncbi:MAG TPA: hypothetical protein VNY31_01255 [Solirubrobacteraceae bacterium]|nr:hypothetical protein [Solirubrobacteraceae bacterium]